MSKYDMQQIVDQATEAVGGALIEFDFGGETFSFQHPLLADDDWREGFNSVDGGEVANARFLLGDQYERFLELGGRASYVGLVLKQAMEESTASLSDGTPTRSGTSSGSSRKPSKRR